MAQSVRRGSLPRLHLVLLRGALRVMVVVGLAVPISQLLAWAWGNPLIWRSDADVLASRAPTLDALDGARVSWDQGASVVVPDAGAGLWLLSILPTAVVGVGVAAVGFLLLRILYATDEGAPFFTTSARRLRLVAATVAVTALAAPLSRGVADAVILQRTVPGASSGVGLDLTPMLVWLVVALLVGVVAEAFAIGTRLHEDTEGLV